MKKKHGGTSENNSLTLAFVRNTAFEFRMRKASATKSSVGTLQCRTSLVNEVGCVVQTFCRNRPECLSFLLYLRLLNYSVQTCLTSKYPFLTSTLAFQARPSSIVASGRSKTSLAPPSKA